MRRWALFLVPVFLVFLTVLLSCANFSHDDSSSDTLIVRGRFASSLARQHTVGLSWSDSADKSAPFCTATIVSSDPLLALTAAHCIAATSARDTGIYRDGEANFIFFESGVMRPVVRAIKHPDWIGPHADIAIVEFEGPMPNGFLPIRIVDSEDELEQGLSRGGTSGVGSSSREFVIAGWGNQSTDGEQPRQLLEANVGLWRFWRTGFGLGLLAFDSPQGRGACYGDSGGPAFYRMEHEWVLAGVTQGSRSAFLRDLPRGLQGNCDLGKSLYTSASRYKGWIKEHYSNANLAGATPSVVPWQGTRVSDSFGEACLLGEDLVRGQWVVVLKLLLLAGTTDCLKAEEILVRQGIVMESLL
jgi:hypothetical protein